MWVSFINDNKISKMKKIAILAMLIAFAFTMNAQNEIDALRFSQSFYQGTARSMAMGGAFGALGADFSSLSTNPAGIGLFRSSEFSLSPGLLNSKTASTYNGMFGDDFRSNFAFSNMGIVLTNKVNENSTKTPWKFYQFGFGMNRTNSFNQRSLIQGDNNDHSRIDVFLDKVWNVSPSNIEDQFPFDLYPAWYVYLLDTVRNSDGDLIYTSPVPQGGIRQYETTTTWGSTNEWLFSGGANLNDVVFLGATLGLPYVRYFKESTFTEKDINDEIDGFDEWNFRETIETRGMGINLKLGIIVWPVDWLRLGASFHTPTYFAEMQDSWYTSIDARLGPDFNRKDSPTGEYQYDLTTPLRAIGSAAIIIGKSGLISADYEFVDYTKMRLRAPDYNFTSENDAIRSSFTSVYNLRLGTEWRVSNFNFRGGYALYSSPYINDLNDGQLTNISLGVGYTENNFAIDLAWVNGTKNQDYYLYSSENYTTNAAKQELTSNHFVVTTRFKF
ncbi:MAG: hypothetical protein CVT92_08110 [Bacteroidetes bacterium HGW-Bacteroidetes-1]|jgi:hypothetical protein|nr:MAG: hypothetical protein CVT92_08110 [Bacteroidetes bacterium HGW-Bacteroidetes-1]